MTLYSTTLDYISKHLPEKVVDDVKCKVINKNYDPNAKQTKFLLWFPLKIDGRLILYWMVRALPDMFEQCAITTEDATLPHTREWIRKRIKYISDENNSGTAVYEDSYSIFKNKKFYFDKSLFEKFCWHEISTALYEKMGETVEKRCYFIIRTDDNVI